MFGAFIALAVFLVFFTVVGLVVLYFMHKDKDGFDFRMIFSAYFYLVAMLSLMAVLVGASSITKAVLSDVNGRDFSYYSYTADKSAIEPVLDKADEDQTEAEKKQQEAFQKQSVQMEKEQIEESYQNDLFTGISTLAVGLLFLLVHMFGWMKMEPATLRSKSFLYKGFVMIQLVVYSLITLVALPTALSQLLRFMYQHADSSASVTPGEPLAIAIWSTPVWVFFVWLTMKTIKIDTKK